MRNWLWIVLVLAGCQAAEEKFERSAPFRRGALEVHIAQDSPAPGFLPVTVDEAVNGTAEVVHMSPVVELTEAHLRRIAVGKGRDEDRILMLTFNDEGTAQLARVSAATVGRRLAFVIDGRVVAAPVILGEITGGAAVIEGDFTQQEAERLAAALAGS